MPERGGRYSQGNPEALPQKTQQPEIRRGEGTWDAEQLRYYLRAMSYNTGDKDFCLALEDFPRHIELGSAWHETFEQMGRETAKDDYERWALIGVTQDRGKVMMSQSFVRARREDPDRINSADVLQAHWEAGQKGILYYVGDVHTHPRDSLKMKVLSKMTPGLLAKRGYILDTEREFSENDLFNMTQEGLWPAVKFLVGPTENRIAFRSRQTIREAPYFMNYGPHVKTAREINLCLAREKKLALYRGDAGQSLTRIFP